MIPEFLMATQSLQALGTLLKTANGLSNYNEIVTAVADVNLKLMQANAVALASQEKQAALSNRVSELENEIRDLRTWEKDSQRYQLTELAPGIFVYGLKTGMENGEPQHFLCVNCMSRRQKSVMQLFNENIYVRILICHNCSSRLSIDKAPPPEQPRSGFMPPGGATNWMG